MNDWISVEDRLPADDEMIESGDKYKWYAVMYWGIESDDDISVGLWRLGRDYHTSGWATPDLTRQCLKRFATHWMPLPKPPHSDPS